MLECEDNQALHGWRSTGSLAGCAYRGEASKLEFEADENAARDERRRSKAYCTELAKKRTRGII